MESQCILPIKSEEGNDIFINVLNVIESIKFNKSFIFYNLYEDDVESNIIYSSILKEKDYTYYLEKITNAQEIKFVNEQIEILKDEILNETTASL